mmetsp:Transcript_42250/g.122122  ORF Transcript_42250/g.122122 Transcript_42250/m.122122 type:complete len:291 (+) Transcript_42250:1258-2130(+)
MAIGPVHPEWAHLGVLGEHVVVASADTVALAPPRHNGGSGRRCSRCRPCPSWRSHNRGRAVCAATALVRRQTSVQTRVAGQSAAGGVFVLPCARAGVVARACRGRHGVLRQGIWVLAPCCSRHRCPRLAGTAEGGCPHRSRTGRRTIHEGNARDRLFGFRRRGGVAGVGRLVGQCRLFVAVVVLRCADSLATGLWLVPGARPGCRQSRRWRGQRSPIAASMLRRDAASQEGSGVRLLCGVLGVAAGDSPPSVQARVLLQGLCGSLGAMPDVPREEDSLRQGVSVRFGIGG